MNYKDTIRQALNFLHIDLTKNLECDRYTKLIMKRSIKNDSNCIDVGCHKGELLTTIIKLSPDGKNYGFEPLPYYYEQLKAKFGGKATIYPYALSDKDGSSSYQFVKNAPAYSGIKKRRYDISTPDIEEITVELRTLDGLIPPETRIDFIKIDVEGGEFGVLKGAKNILKESKPIVIFEFGLGASDFYGTKPDELYNYLTEDIGLKISLLKTWVKGGTSLNLNEFEDVYNSKKEYYFIAHK